jgi:hypothetical protein
MRYVLYSDSFQTELRQNPNYSELFQMVIPSSAAESAAKSYYPPQIQELVESATLRQRSAVHAEIVEFTKRKKEEFRIWRDQVRSQAQVIANLVSAPNNLQKQSASETAGFPITTFKATTVLENNVDMFPKTPVSVFSPHGPSPFAAASCLVRSRSDEPTPPQRAKIVPPPPSVSVPLSSSLKSPSSSNYPKPVKRVMFQDPVDVEPQSEIEDEFISSAEPAIVVDGTSLSYRIIIVDELFDFDETIPTPEPAFSQKPHSSTPSVAVDQRTMAAPVTRFRRRSVEKYQLPEEEDVIDEQTTSRPTSNRVQNRGTAIPHAWSVSSSKPIAITPPARSFLDGLGIGDDEDVEMPTMKGYIERSSLKNARSLKSNYMETRLWDIPGDYYRSVPS